MSDYSMCHCEGVGCGVAVGVGRTAAPIRDPLFPRGTVTGSLEAVMLLEQAQTPTASMSARANTVISGMHSCSPLRIDHLPPGTGLRRTGV